MQKNTPNPYSRDCSKAREVESVSEAAGGDSSRRRFLQKVSGAALAAGIVGQGSARRVAIAASPIRARAEIAVGSRRQLLFDDFFLGRGSAKYDSYPHNIRWTLGKVEKSSNQSLLFADKPWEDSIAWTCVLHDEGRHRLWYHLDKQSARVKGKLPEASVCGYAESDDGLNWKKPLFKHIERWGFPENNIVFDGGPDAWSMELGNVFKDPGALPKERYKMLYPCWESKAIYGAVEGVPYVGQGGVLRGAHSPDGIHWTRYPHIFLGRYTDSQNVATYDPVLGKYVAYIRATSTYGDLDVGEHPVKATRRGRAVSRIESDDYRSWSYPELAFAGDFQDGLGVDFYNPGYAHYDGAENAHFLFPSALHHRDGRLQVQVAVSRDNRRWLRPTRDAFIPMGANGDFDDYWISVSPGFVPAGTDHLALYYRAMNTPHSGAVKHLAPKGRESRVGMGRVLFKRDRIVGIEAGPDEGAFWTRPLLFEGRRLVLNAEPTGPDPQLQVELVGVGVEPAYRSSRGKYMDDAPASGHTFEECIPLTGDILDGVMRWKRGADLGQWSGKPVRLHFRLSNMRIYAFQFVG